MKRLTLVLVIIGTMFCIASATSQACAATAADDVTFVQVKSLAGKKITSPLILRAQIISDCRGMNNAVNENIDAVTVDYSNDYRTAYIQSSDGTSGLRIVFDSIYDNKFPMGALVDIDLNGCTITMEDSPQRYTITGLKASACTLVEADRPVTVREKYISELTEEDVYTLVSLCDCELSTKEGAFANIADIYGQKTRYNDLDPVWGFGDAWGTWLKDSRGSFIFMHVNTRCEWHRNLQALPQGIGPVTGIVVSEGNRRYSNSIGSFSIRPRGREDIAINNEKSTSYTTITDWSWDHNPYCALNLEKNGVTRFLVRPGIADDRVCSEIGTGWISAPKGVRMSVDSEYNTRDPQDGWGLAKRANAALRLDCCGKDWSGSGNGIVIETSLKDVKARGITLTFSFVAGNQDIRMTTGFPVHWTVETSTDGKNFTTVSNSVILKGLCFTPRQVNGVLQYPDFDAALGFPEYILPLSSELMGQDRVFIRIRPSEHSECRGETVFALRIGRITIHSY